MGPIAALSALFRRRQARHERRKIWLRLLVIFVIAFALIRAAGDSAFVAPIDRIYQDLWHRMAGLRELPKHVVVISIDDTTLAAYREDPLVFWTPFYAKAAEVLRQVGVPVVGLDMMLSISPEKWLRKNKIDKGQFAGTFDIPFRKQIASGQLIMVAASATSPAGHDELILPSPSYILAVPDFDLLSHLGVADLQADSDGVVRRFRVDAGLRLAKEAEGMPTLTFAALLAIRAAGQPADAKQWKLGGIARTVSSRSRSIRYAGPPGTVPRVPLQVLLAKGARDNLAVQALQGKVAIIGGEFHGVNDVHVTPYTTGLFGTRGSYMTGPEIQANIVENLLSGTFRRPLAWVVEYPVQIAVLALALALFQWLRPLSGLIILLAAWVIAALVSYMAFRFDLIVDAAALQIGLAILFLAILSLKYSTEERERERITNHFLLIRDTPSEEVYVLNMFRMRGSRI